jgi:hypothetical protein
VTCRSGEVTLKGTVDNRQMKRMAEECADSCVGVKDVENQLRVSPAQQDGQSNAQGTSSSKKMA